ncbi:carboxylate methylbutanoyltransferase mlcH [Psilocybe cubensis]|uniref:Beta-lactamase-related domain-containing protein n=2 Tax=Psilocybe cubensis TaxID=181762 RepID=A0A8H7XRP2_PSICU|nr:carboxylate methylbutanoyltransferase mlcH [Psilocybe cubensis]KAH9474693.1 carboxylate methylbutanoyltransferase mlcH [Psilocybe cubensis]
MVHLSVEGEESLNKLADQVVLEKNIPGFLFGVTSVDQELYLKTWGYNVIAALQLLEQEKITLETPVSDYLPEFSDLVIIENQMAEVLTYKPTKTVMRYKHLLDYTCGLYYPSKEGDLPGIPVLFEPGENWANGWGSDILGFMIEKITGQTLEKYLQDNVFKPLDITASFYLTPEIKEKLVDLTYRRGGQFERWNNQSRIIEQDPSKVACHMGGDGLYASLKGYLNLLRHLLRIKSGKITNGIISAESVQSIFEPSLHETASNMLSRLLMLDPSMPRDAVAQWGTAIGVTATDWPGRRKKGSGFWWGWAHTFFHIDPSTGIATVFGTQVIPMPDRDVFKIFARFEETLYAGLAE